MRALTLSALLLLGCDAPTDLFVDLRTDLVPGLEVARVETGLIAADGTFEDGPVERVITHDIDPTLDYAAGQRIAELPDVVASPARLIVRLIAADGRTLQQRPVLVSLAHSTAVTVVMTRDCNGVECGTADPTAIACHGGTCGPSECVEERPETCVVECRSADECPNPVGPCAVAECSAGGVCLESSSGTCAADEVCHPTGGCIPLDGTVPEVGTPTVLRTFTDTEDVALTGVASAGSGDIVVLGVARGSVEAGGGPLLGGFVARYADDGGFSWATDALDGPTAVTSSTGAIVVGGTIPTSPGDADILVSYYDPMSGTEIRIDRFDNDGVASSFDIDADDTTVCTGGWNQGDVHFDDGSAATMRGQAGPYYACFDSPGGAHQHSLDSMFAAPHGGWVTGIVVLPDRVILAGAIAGPEPFIGPTPFDGGFVAAVARVDGTPLWATSWPLGPSFGEATVRAIDAGPGGEVVVVGQYTATGPLGGGFVLPPPLDGSDTFVVRIDPSDGRVLWLTTLAVPGGEFSSPHVAVGTGVVHVAEVSNATLPDIVLRTLDLTTGVRLRESTFGGAGADVVLDLDLDPSGRLLAVARFDADIPELALVSVGGTDGFLLRVDP